jgi:predicted nuclease with TOPRIM domain
MAIKQKFPSPQEIKNTPQSFTKQELNELKNLRDRIDEISFQFGQLSIQKIKLEEQESTLKNKLKSIEKEETTIAKKLTDKYGKGSIDLETGTFAPLE